MKKLLALTLVALMGFLPVPVLAQEDTNTVTNTNTVVEDSMESGETSPSNPGGLSPEKRQERINSYKERLVEKLSTFEQKKLQGACKGAQTVVIKLNDNVAQVRKIREKLLL